MSPSTFLSRVILAVQNFPKRRSNPLFLSVDSIAHRSDSFSHPSGSSAIDEPAHHCDRAHLAAAGPENVQCRAVFIQFLRTLVSQSRRTESNPWLTHDTVEALQKLFRTAQA